MYRLSHGKSYDQTHTQKILKQDYIPQFIMIKNEILTGSAGVTNIIKRRDWGI